jgi:O-antigen/teichoic acid export membrane protein
LTEETTEEPNAGLEETQRAARRTLLAHSLIYFPAVAGPAFLGFATLAILTRLLAPAEYGRYALAVAAATSMTGILGDWLMPSLMRFLPEHETDLAEKNFLRQMMGMATLTSLVAGLGVIALVAAAAPFRYSAAAASLTVAWIICRLCMAELRAALRSGTFSVASLSTAVGTLGVGLALYAITRDAVSFLWGGAIANAVTALVFLGMRWRGALGGRRESASDRSRVREVLQFGIPIAVTAVGSQALFLADRYLLVFLRGDAAVGLYSPTYNIAERIMNLTFAPVLSAVYPLAARSWATKDRDGARDHLELGQRLFIIIGGWVAGSLVVFSSDIVAVVLGSGYHQAAPVTGIVALGSFSWYLATLFHQGLEMAKRTRVITVLVVSCAVANILLNLVLIPHFGYLGSAWATVASYVAYAFVAYGIGLRIVGTQIRLAVDTLVRVLVFAGLIYLARRAIPEGTVEHLILLAGSAPLFVGWLWITKEPTAKDVGRLLLRRSP